MFARDELDEITQGLIGPMKKEMPRVPPTNDNLYSYFITRSRKNLHVVLCFSPVSLLFLSFFPGEALDKNTKTWNTGGFVLLLSYNAIELCCSLFPKPTLPQIIVSYLNAYLYR